MKKVIKYNKKIITDISSILGILGVASAVMSEWGDKVIAVYCQSPALPFLRIDLSSTPYCDVVVGFGHSFLYTAIIFAIVFLLAILKNLFYPAILKKKTSFSVQLTKEDFVQQIHKLSDSLIIEKGYMPAPNILLDWKEMRQGTTIVKNITEADSIKITGEMPFKGLVFEMIEKPNGLKISIISENYDVKQKEYITLLTWLDSMQDD